MGLKHRSFPGNPLHTLDLAGAQSRHFKECILHRKTFWSSFFFSFHVLFLFLFLYICIYGNLICIDIIVVLETEELKPVFSNMPFVQ